MPTTYPATKQNFNNPAGTNTLSGEGTVDHASLHSDINDTMEAVEDTLGTNSGTSIFKHFTAGQFPIRATGVSAIGTLQQTIVGGTYNNNIIGTPALTGGTTTSTTHNSAILGTPSSVGGTISAALVGGTADFFAGTIKSATLGTPTTTGGITTSGTINNSVIGTQDSTGGTIRSAVVNNSTVGTIALTGGTLVPTIVYTQLGATSSVGTGGSTLLFTTTSNQAYIAHVRGVSDAGFAAVFEVWDTAGGINSAKTGGHATLSITQGGAGSAYLSISGGGHAGQVYNFSVLRYTAS